MALLSIEFPTFVDWPRCKIFYVNHMSVAQENSHAENIIVTEEFEAKFSSCSLCSQKFTLAFDTSLEEWVYKQCKILGGIPYHFPLCFEYAHEVEGNFQG